MISLTKLIEKIDSLTIRERAVILLGMLAVLYILWDSFLMEPLQNQQKIIKSDLQQKQAAQAAMNIQLQKIVEENKQDANLLLEKQLQELKVKLEEANTDIQMSTAHLVSPKDMAKILETMLNKTDGLTLVSASGLGSTALIQEDNAKNTDKKTGKEEQNKESPGEDMGNAYKHGLRIEFEGDYMATLRYLRELESLDWKFFWNTFDYKVKKYPQGHTAIEVFTLSLDKNWIDV